MILIIIIIIQKLGCGSMKWVDLAQVMGTCEWGNGNESSGSIKRRELPRYLRNT